MENSLKYYILAIILCSLLGLSCSSPSDEKGDLVYLPPPIITGIWLTNVQGDPRGAWGNPSTLTRPKSGNFEGEFFLYVPTPNPSNSMATFTFTLPRESPVSLFVARARLEGQESIISNTVGGGTIAQSNNIIVRKLADQFLQAGQYSIPLDWKDDNGNDLPPGFYRIYAIMGGKLFWQDAFLSRTPDDLPPGLQKRP